MRRLTGPDAQYLYTETRRSSGAIGMITILDPMDPDGPSVAERVERLRELFAARMHLVPVLRQRVRRVLFDISHPVLVDDPDFDIGFHVRHTALPAPGDDGQLSDLLGRLLSSAFDHGRPPWEVYIIEGYQGDRVLQLFRTHHAVADGTAMFHIVTTLLDSEPEPELPDAPEWDPEPDPSMAQLLADAGKEKLRDPLATPRAIGRLARDVAQAARKDRARGGDEDPSDESGAETPELGAEQAPPSPFNVLLSGSRAVRLLDLPLDDVLAVRRRSGGTVNDLVLALVGGGVRRYLERTDADTAPSLISFLPISLAEEGHTAGNAVTSAAIPLGTDEPDPRRRVSAIAEATAAAKERAKVAPPPVVLDMTAVTGPALGSALQRLAAATGASERYRLANLAVSNVGAIPRTYYTLGTRVDRLYPIGPLTDGLGLNITLLSYEGRLEICVLSDPRAVPEPDDLVADLTAEWEALGKAFA